jgi:hypothetical protein
VGLLRGGVPILPLRGELLRIFQFSDAQVVLLQILHLRRMVHASISFDDSFLVAARVKSRLEP